METSYYELLGVSEDASLESIKQAYVLKIRQYPHEQFPERFQEIRKAYEVLMNPKSRNEYDIMFVYGEEIRFLEQLAQEAYDDENYSDAIRYYKKILMIEPTLHQVRNRYALALLYSGEIEKTKKQFKKLILIEPENPQYFYNLAYTLEIDGDFEEAGRYYRKAISLDPLDLNIYLSLCDMYILDQSYDLARDILNESEVFSQNNAMGSFMFLFKLLQIDAILSDLVTFDRTLRRITDLLETNPKEIDFVSNEIGRLTLQFSEKHRDEMALQLIQKGIEMDPFNEHLAYIRDSIQEKSEVFIEYKILNKDEKVIQPIKYVLSLYLFGDELDEQEFNEHREQMLANVQGAAKEVPELTINSIKRLIIKYPELYSSRKDFLTKIIDMSKNYQMAHEQFQRLKLYPTMINPIKRLIALYISNLTEEERNDYFEDIMDEMEYQSCSDIIQSIQILEQEFPQLYQLNTDFFQDLKEMYSF